jgi:hypothetical protein
MTAVEINADNSALPEILGHSVSHSPWGYHATTIGGKSRNKTKRRKQKYNQGGKSNSKSNKNKRRSRYTRQKHNKRTHKQQK